MIPYHQSAASQYDARQPVTSLEIVEWGGNLNLNVSAELHEEVKQCLTGLKVSRESLFYF